MGDVLREPIAGPYDPAWSELEYLPGGARDALRLETVGETILEDLLPGINNQTRRARYYSFWAWVLHEFIRDEDAVHNQRGFYEWLRPREDMLILAHLSHGHDTGAAGTNQGNRYWQNGEPEKYPLGWLSLPSVKGGAYQFYYRGVLEQMNIIDSGTAQPHDALRRPIGVALAGAYGSSVRDTAYVEHYWDATWVTREIVEDFAEAGCLCRLSRFPAEREALVDAFFRFDVNDAYAIKRLASLCFFLDIIDQARGAPLDIASMGAVFYYWSYGTDYPYVPEGNMLSPAKRWRVFQLRQYYVFAIESLWTLFLAKIHNRYSTPDEYLDWLFSELDLGAVGERFGLSLPASRADELTLSALQEAVEAARTGGRFEPGPAAREGDFDEHRLYLMLDRAEINQDATTWSGCALLMLSLMHRRCRDWRGDVGWDYAIDVQGSDDLSIEGYLRQAERAIDEGWTVARWLSWFHQRHLWLRHRRVALQKMVSRRMDPSLFTWDENKFYGVSDDWPSMNGPRFHRALQIMEDLLLVRSDYSEHQTYFLLPEGEELLQRFRTYAIPESE